MRVRNLLISSILWAGAVTANAQELEFTTTGSCASYITWNSATSHQADSVYLIKKTSAAIVIDGVAEDAWLKAVPAVIKKIAHEKKAGEVLDLSNYPQSETDLYATYKALWTDNGMYMFIDVKDDLVRYQNPEYQWENDGIEFYFAKAVGEGKIQVIIPAMVGTSHPDKPEAKDFESGSATGSDPAYKVFGFDANNWDESTFKWAIKKTATGYTMEVYMDKDIVTNGNSETNFGLNKMFAGDVNIDEADEKQNTNTPALYVREGSLALLGNSNQEYASSNYYGWFKMVEDDLPGGLEFTTTGSCADYITWNNATSKQADSIYTVEKTKSVIVIDGVAESAWVNAIPAVIKKIAHEKKPGEILDLSLYPQSETDLKATYKALWTDDGMYMFIDVQDDLVRYQNPEYQWENDGIEFYFAKAVGEGKIQVIIPAMVGTTHPSKPEAKDFESGSATGSDPSYKVFGFDANNWDESTFKWAIKRTATGYAMEVYMDKDIVTNGNSETHFGKDKMFAGDVNVDESDEKQNTNTPALYVREGSLAMLGNSNQEYASSNYYGWFKLVDNTTSGELEFTTTGSCADYITWNNATSHQADSIYKIEKSAAAITIDGVAEIAWDEANLSIIKKIAHEKKAGEVLDLSLYPQSETDLYAKYKALWNENGVYMFIEVKDDMVRYQNPEYQWENDGIEFYFAKAKGEGKIQVIIPAMVGTTHPSKPEAKDFESGSATGSDPAYKVFGFDANNWDESTFNWAIKKTDVGYNLEVYMDKDIVTNGNSDTNFGLNKMFAGDINVDEADEKQNTNTPALYVREGTLALLGNSNQEYASSNYYGWFKMVNEITTGISANNNSDFVVLYNSAYKEITVRSTREVSATLYNIAGQAMTARLENGKMSVSDVNAGIYILNVKDDHGNHVGSKKIAIF